MEQIHVPHVVFQHRSKLFPSTDEGVGLRTPGLDHMSEEIRLHTEATGHAIGAADTCFNPDVSLQLLMDEIGQKKCHEVHSVEARRVQDVEGSSSSS